MQKRIAVWAAKLKAEFEAASKTRLYKRMVKGAAIAVSTALAAQHNDVKSILFAAGGGAGIAFVNFLANPKDEPKEAESEQAQ